MYSQQQCQLARDSRRIGKVIRPFAYTGVDPKSLRR